ncbi:MAG: MarR family winged helix-turn-helix transcriptional regulator [Alphaproteobacteria bacterium]|nr:MarR family winged helix-turn-helix transcriptional regulator [Alphaproteobacteria bacterium]MBU0794191.1 MarR family winged helix-turn-helix transcriptional regulator [Alphaproteobacteria bacterium]MBU0874725.1 MarR family winged helix-turn-helix transcriptional regulator [Alphaproteobacteria bacterium]MBU1768583.1 MarR family winged helix-turn-helix transcriptional regulator [Alphaproteobacteria bacterium]
MARKKAGASVDRPSFRNLMTFRLHMVARFSEGISEEYYRRHLGLSLPECRVIGITASYGSVSFKQVAADAHLEKSYASRVVSSLVERGIIEKLANPSDSRSVLLQLTDHGKTVHEQTYALALRLNEVLQMPFTRKQVDDFLSFLAGLDQQLKRVSGVVEDVDALGNVPRRETPPPPASESAPDAPMVLDRAFAQKLHDMLGRYLADNP